MTASPSRETIFKRLTQYRLAMESRDEWVREAHKAGFTKYKIWQITGLGRSTIDRILKNP